MKTTVLAISGKPGLYKLINRGANSLIVETLDASHRRMPAFAADKVIALQEIAMYTNDEEVALMQVLESIKSKYDGKVLPAELKKASKDKLFEFMGEVLPEFDRDRVYPGDVKKLISWYNILVENGITDFMDEPKATEETAE